MLFKFELPEKEMPEVFVTHLVIDVAVVVLGALAMLVMAFMGYDVTAMVVGGLVVFVLLDAGRYAYLLLTGRWKHVRGTIVAGYERPSFGEKTKNLLMPIRTRDIILVDDITGRTYALAVSNRTTVYRQGMRVDAYLPDGGSEYVKDGIEYTYAYKVTILPLDTSTGAE